MSMFSRLGASAFRAAKAQQTSVVGMRFTQGGNGDRLGQHW